MSHTGFIHSIQTLGANDGPGLRFVAFLQGCRMRCAYCHNPDTWARTGGREMTAEALVAMAARYRPYFEKTGAAPLAQEEASLARGGITLSGGEPLLQPQFCLEVTKLAHAQGIHVCLDTAGGQDDRNTAPLLDAVDLVLLDIKRADDEAFRALTGREASHTWGTLSHCSRTQKPLWARMVVVPGLNDTEAEMRALAYLLRAANVQRAQLLPYHTLGRPKWDALGIPYRLEGVPPLPPERLAELQAVLDEALPKAQAAYQAGDNAWAKRDVFPPPDR